MRALSESVRPARLEYSSRFYRDVKSIVENSVTEGLERLGVMILNNNEVESVLDISHLCTERHLYATRTPSIPLKELVAKELDLKSKDIGSAHTHFSSSEYGGQEGIFYRNPDLLHLIACPSSFSLYQLDNGVYIREIDSQPLEIKVDGNLLNYWISGMNGAYTGYSGENYIQELDRYRDLVLGGSPEAIILQSKFNSHRLWEECLD